MVFDRYQGSGEGGAKAGVAKWSRFVFMTVILGVIFGVIKDGVPISSVVPIGYNETPLHLAFLSLFSLFFLSPNIFFII